MAKSWTCFFCDETFTDIDQARDHFGWDNLSDAACKLNAQEGGLAAALRRAEDELLRYRMEDADLYREIYGMRADHQVALRREEEAGYERGLADGRALSEIA